MLDFDKLEEKMEEKTSRLSFSRFLCLHKHVEKWVFSVGISASSMALFWQILTSEKYFSEVCSFVIAASAALVSTDGSVSISNVNPNFRSLCFCEL